ncbi:AbrB family transcriptional regulator [Fervidibacillus halotolerans]|uniref:AbrB family transcriptional regulator n=1 Tax=Fervidibacillus halotolerans TaxID=2980027 RepID=A0A9E8M282_9BACI|nr:AbrB family transcriptional regulator [Fervidibacillus halotolerans]WAA13106.1 AbrB family transcriptional regulator [Fervidibacillus halotolerans]
MGMNRLLQLMITMVTASIGGFVFHILHTPLPWVLGALSFVTIWQGFLKQKVYFPIFLRNIGFIILGLYFGMYFTTETFLSVKSYFIPFFLLTSILIFTSMKLGSFVSRWIPIDEITSVFSSIPGGLSEMTIASEDLNGKSSYVAIFQTIRLLTVLFIVPSIMMTFYSGEGGEVLQGSIITSFEGSRWNYLFFFLPILTALFLQNRIPAGVIIGSLGVTAILSISPISLPPIPSPIVHMGQIFIGIGIGKNIFIEDLKKAGKYGFVYFGISLIIIMISFVFGGVMASFSSLDMKTSILSFAPGGLFEMVLTAYSIGGDPAIVSSLQLIRVLLIIMAIPPLLRIFFKKRYILYDEQKRMDK